MPAVLNTNSASLYASKNLQSAQSKMAQSVERLSSGLRVNRAKDDAAGLGIANALTSQINSANQGIRNLNDGISMVQTAEGAIAAAMEMGQRILTLATQGANGTMGATDRTAIQNEMKQLLTAINSIGTRTKFSGTTLFASTAINVFNGKESTDKVEITAAALATIGSASGSALTLSSWINTETAITSSTYYQSIATSASLYITALDTQRGLLGALQNQMEYSVSNIAELSANLTSARSRIVDTDYASETANLTKGQILQQAATAMLAQANQMPNVI